MYKIYPRWQFLKDRQVRHWNHFSFKGTESHFMSSWISLTTTLMTQVSVEHTATYNSISWSACSPNIIFWNTCYCNPCGSSYNNIKIQRIQCFFFINVNTHYAIRLLKGTQVKFCAWCFIIQDIVTAFRIHKIPTSSVSMEKFSRYYLPPSFIEWCSCRLQRHKRCNFVLVGVSSWKTKHQKTINNELSDSLMSLHNFLKECHLLQP